MKRLLILYISCTILSADFALTVKNLTDKEQRINAVDFCMKPIEKDWLLLAPGQTHTFISPIPFKYISFVAGTTHTMYRGAPSAKQLTLINRLELDNTPLLHREYNLTGDNQNITAQLSQ